MQCIKKNSQQYINLLIKASKNPYQQQIVGKYHIFIAKLLKELPNLIKPIALMLGNKNPLVLQWVHIINRVVNLDDANFKVKNPASDEEVKKYISIYFSEKMMSEMTHNAMINPTQKQMLNLFLPYQKLSSLMTKIIKDTFTKDEIKFYNNVYSKNEQKLLKEEFSTHIKKTPEQLANETKSFLEPIKSIIAKFSLDSSILNAQYQKELAELNKNSSRVK